MGNASVPNTETGAAVLTSAITRAVTQETPAAIAVPQAAAASAVENVMPKSVQLTVDQSTTGPQAAPPAISTPESAPERKIDFLGIELTLGEGIPPAMFPVDISVWDAESPADMENIQAHLKALSEYNYSLNEITIAQGQPGNSIAGFDNNNDRLVFTTISREMARCEDGQDQNYFASMRGRFLYHLEKLLAHKLNKLQTEKRRKEAIHSAFPDVDLESLTPSDNVFIGPGDQPMPAVGIIKIPAQKTLELPTRVSIVYGEMGRSGDSRTPVIIAHIPQNLGITPYHTKYEPTAVSNEAGAAYRTLYMNLSDSSIFPVYADASLPGVQMLRDGSGNSSVCTISRLLDLTGTVADVEQLEKLNLDDTNKDNIQQTIKVHYELCAQEFAKAGVEITHFSYAYFPESRRGYLLSLWGRKNEDGEERLKETNLKFVRGKLAERFANAISSEAVDSNPLPEATVSPSSDGDHSVPEIAPLAEHVTAAPVEPTTPVVPTAPATPSSAPPKKPKRTGLRATIAAAAIAAAAGGIGYALWRNTAPPTRHQPTAAPITDTASPETSKPAAPPTATPETQPPPKPLSEITEDEKKKILDSF